jgi:hypothetical protein
MVTSFGDGPIKTGRQVARERARQHHEIVDHMAANTAGTSGDQNNVRVAGGNVLRAVCSLDVASTIPMPLRLLQ